MASARDGRGREKSGGSTDRISPSGSTPESPGGKGKKRVGFSARVKNDDTLEESSPQFKDEEDVSRNSSVVAGPGQQGPIPEIGGQQSSNVDQLQLTESLNKLKHDSTPTVLRSALRKGMSGRDSRPGPLDLAGIDDLSTKLEAEHHARARATGLERDVASAPGSRTGSPDKSLSRFRIGQGDPRRQSASSMRARDGNHHNNHHQIWNSLFHKGGVATGQNTPDAEELEEYFPQPSKYRTGGLSAHLLNTWWGRGSGYSSRSSSFGGESASSSPGSSTPIWQISPPEDDTPPLSPKPKQWPWIRSPRASDFGIDNLVSATASSTALAGSDISAEFRKQASKKPDYFSSPSATNLSEIWTQPRKRKKMRDIDITIKKHVQETQIRKRYILKLCRALMEYGAPTHRLEAYLSMTSRVLEIQAQFLYFPGTMIVSFDDPGTQTTEMKLVRVTQGVDLGKMKDAHRIYKDVSHDLIGVEEGMRQLEELSTKRNKFPIWLRILAYGFGSAFVAPFAFDGRLIDLPVCFGLGLILGVLQLIVAPKSDLYASLFEIVATIITSFLSRLFGSINYSNDPSQRIFCFSALTQSSIALILPGFTVLSAALELQSRSIVAGSVRIVFAIVYSLWIGYGLTIGTAIYGAINRNAESQATCQNPLSADSQWTFLFVPAYTFCLAIINQAKWRQMPMMILISFAGYQVNYWAGTKFKGNTQIASTLGAAAIGVLANGYSRVGRPIDERAARLEGWLTKTLKGMLNGRKGTRNLSEDQGHRRKSSIAGSIVNLLPKQLRPMPSHEEKDIEASTSEEDDAKADNISNATTAAEQTDDEKNEETNKKSGPNAEELENTKSTKDGKPRQVNYILAAAAMLPAIFVQVPSGVSVAGSLISGIQAANELTNANSTSSGTSMVTQFNGNALTDISFTVAAIVIQVAIGITIGLFIGSILVYPTGKGGSIGHGKKSRSGLFAF